MLLDTIIPLKVITTLYDTFFERFKLQMDNLPDFLISKRIEDDYFIYPVHELRFECMPDDFHHMLISMCRICQYLLRTKVRCHDDNRIREIHDTPLSISQSAIIKNLQKNIEHIRMSLFNLIKENY